MAQWSAHEDEQLRKLVKEYGPKRWSIIASKLKTKGSKQCRRRWKNHLNADLKSGGWTAEEDRILMEGHRLYGNKWTEIAKMVGGRTDNAVKNRYAAICKRDSKGAARGGAARGGRGARKARASDSDAGASDIEVEEDSDEEDVKRTSSSSISREPSPVRGGRGHATVDSAGTHSTPPQRGATHMASPPLAKTAAAAADPEAVGSAGLRSSVLGRRRQAGAGSPPLQPEPEAAGPGKRRAVQQGGGGGVSRQPLAATTPQTPLVQVPQMHQPQEALVTTYQQQQQQQQQHQQQRQVPERVGRSGSATAGAGRMVEPEEVVSDDTEEELPPPPPPPRQAAVTEQPELVRRASSGGREVEAMACGQPKKLPLTINIPNAASAEPHAVQPPSAAATVYGIEIRVLKDLLTPCEIQYARELNDMQLPLHINVDEDPSTLAGRASGMVLEPPLTTSRQAAQNALTALFSPGSAVGGSAADFNDVLKWFQTGFTPRSACGEDITPRLMSRMGLTPCGLSGGRSGHCVEDAGMLGTGLTPKCLRDSGSPRSLSSGGGGSSMGGLTPQLAELSAAKRARRQVAVAAAVAAAANEMPPPPQQEQQRQHPQVGNMGLHSMDSGVPLSTTGGSGVAAAAGITSPGGMELHAGHRQLLTKLIQTAAAADASAQGGAAAAAAAGGIGGVGGETDGGRLRNELPSPSAGLITPEPLPGRGSLTRNISGAAGPNADGGSYPSQQVSGAPSAGVVVMPYFSQQELLLLLDVLNSEDLQALPPPPPDATAAQQ